MILTTPLSVGFCNKVLQVISTNCFAVPGLSTDRWRRKLGVKSSKFIAKFPSSERALN
jgi:hypothetical protein